MELTAYYGTCDHLIVSVFQTFGLKYFHQQLFLSASTAGVVFGEFGGETLMYIG